MNIILFLWAFIESVMLSATNFLNKYTRDYRYVVKVLKKERKILKVVLIKITVLFFYYFNCCTGKNGL